MSKTLESWTFTPIRGKRPNYVDVARSLARQIAVRDDPPGSRPRDIRWLEGNRFALDGVGVCKAVEAMNADGVWEWTVAVETLFVISSTPPERVPVMTEPDPAEDRAAACRGLADKMTTVSGLLDELFTQVDAHVIGQDAVDALGQDLEVYYRRSGTVSSALGRMADTLRRHAGGGS